MDGLIKNKVTKLLIIYIAIILAGSLGYFLFYLFNHGKLTIETNSAVTKIEVYSKPNYSLSDTIKSKKSMDLKSGDYLIKVYFEKNQSYSAEVSIKSWLQTTVMNPKVAENTPIKVLDSVQQDYLPIGNDNYISFNSTQKTQVFANPDIIRNFKLTAVTNAHYTADGTLLLAVNKNKGADFYYYNQQTGVNTFISNIPSTKEIGLYYSDDGIYTILDGQFYIVNKNGISKYPLSKDINYSINSTTPIISKNSNKIAFLSGNDYSIKNADVEEKVNTNDLRDVSVNIYSLESLENGNIITSLALEKTADISGISLSPDSNYVAIIHDNYTQIFNITSGKQVMSVVSSADTNNVYWLDNNSFIFMDNDLSISIVNISNKESYTLLAPNSINISSLCAYINGYLYFTGFNTESEVRQSLPAAYYIKLKL
ncbi:MAG: hypothetical protein WCP03_02500 [Candidatus Saccharibacteria bacterium]